jgi:hypothetical protein
MSWWRDGLVYGVLVARGGRLVVLTRRESRSVQWLSSRRGKPLRRNRVALRRVNAEDMAGQYTVAGSGQTRGNV